MVHRPVFLEQIGRAISNVVRMGEPEVYEERIPIFCFFPFVQVVDHLLPVPMAAGFFRSAPLGRVMTDRELGVGRTMTVTILASTHGIVACLVENGGQTILDRVGDSRLLLLFLVLFSPGSLQVPDRSPRHDHSPRGRTYRAGHRAHVVSLVKGHALRRQLADGRGLQSCGRVIGLEIEGRLVVG